MESLSSDDSVSLNKAEIKKLKNEVMQSQMKKQYVRTKRFGIKYGDLTR